MASLLDEHAPLLLRREELVGRGIECGGDLGREFGVWCDPAQLDLTVMALADTNRGGDSGLRKADRNSMNTTSARIHRANLVERNYSLNGGIGDKTRDSPQSV